MSFLLTPSIDDAQFVAASRMLSAVNANITNDQQLLIEINGVLENGAYGLNPQQVADGCMLKQPDLPIFLHLGLTIKTLAGVGCLLPIHYPKREWLYVISTKRSIATQVPWSSAPLQNGGVYATEPEATVAAAAMLADWRLANDDAESPVAFNGAL